MHVDSARLRPDSETRCPYCRDAVAGEPAHVCPTCGATQHVECRDAHRACVACGFGASPLSTAVSAADRYQGGWPTPLHMVLALIAIVVATAVSVPVGLAVAAFFLVRQVLIRRAILRRLAPLPGTGRVERLVVGKEGVHGQHLETILVPSYLPVKTRTCSLEVDADYVLEASGAFTVWDAGGARAFGIPRALADVPGHDAVYCFAEWRTGKEWPAMWSQLLVDGRTLGQLNGSPLPYAPDHIYRVRVRGAGRPLELWCTDALEGKSWTSNGGALTVRLFRIVPAEEP